MIAKDARNWKSCKRCQKLIKWMRVIWNNSLNQDEVIDKQGSVTVRKTNRGRGENHRQDGGVTSAFRDTYLNTKGLCKTLGRQIKWLNIYGTVAKVKRK